MHYLQKHILDLLRQSSELRYRQLQPDDIESSHFKYHLDSLIKDGLVEQKSRGLYALTEKGKTVVDRLSEGRVNPHQTPKVITYTLVKDSNNYYLQRKDKEPYRALINMIGGKLHIGESAQQAASREVLEKTGQKLDALKLHGVAEIRINKAGSLVSHVIAYVFVASVDNSKLSMLVKVPISDITSRQDLAPDLPAILKAITTAKSPFFISLDIDW